MDSDHGKDALAAKSRMIRGLGALLAGALLLLLLLPGPHKPDSFSLTQPSSWWSILQPLLATEIPERSTQEPLSQVQQRSDPAAQSLSRSTLDQRRSEPAAEAPDPASFQDPSFSEASRPDGPGAPDSDHEDEAHLSIAGSVLDDAGAPLPGIAVHNQDDGSTVLTNELGMFLIERLGAGEYLLSVTESATHHGTQRTVRAGAQAADLHLQRKGSIEIFGRVTDFNGNPVPNAGVRVLGGRQQGSTDSSGGYEIHAELTRAGTQPVLDFSHPEYRDVRKRVATDPAEIFAPVQVDVVMDSEHDKAGVYGWVSGPQGEAVAGTEVRLLSQQPASFHLTVSNEAGEFGFDQVEIGSAYRIRANPPDQGYKRYLSEVFPVGPDGAVHDINLEASDEAEFSGSVVDLDGKPVQDFVLWLDNRAVPGHHSIAVRTDHRGHFEPVLVPAGTIQLGTRSSPSLSATGIEVPPGEATHMQIPMDWGKNWLLGRVVDSRGEPVARATVVAQWQHQFPEVRSASRRQTLSDLGGYFNFANLAAPVYQLTIKAEGFQRHQAQVGPHGTEEVIVELRRRNSADEPGDG